MGRRSRIMLSLIAIDVMLVFLIQGARFPAPAPGVVPPLPITATEYDASIAGCAHTCARERLAGNAEALRRRDAVTRRATWACFGAGFGCAAPHLEERSAAGPWEILGLVDDARTGFGIDFSAQVTMTSFGFHCGPVRLGWTVRPAAVAGAHAVYPAAVLGYRWVRHDYFASSSALTAPASRTPVATSWELERSVVGMAMVPSPQLLPEATARDLRRLVDTRLGLPATPSLTDIDGRFVGETGVEPGPPCDMPIRRMPPTVTGALLLNRPGETQPRVLYPATGRAVLLVAGCSASTGRTAKITLRAAGGAELGFTEFPCTDELTVGVVLPLAGAGADPSPYTLDTQGAPGWSAYAYSVPLMHSQTE